jgi:hypothetical protein
VRPLIGELLSNPLVIALIIGIVTTVFNSIFKENKQETEKHAPAQNRPSKQENTSEKALPEEMTSELNPVQHQYEKIKKERHSKQHIKPEKLQVEVLAEKEKKGHHSFIELKKDTVVQGFIMCEVFGPPRSINQHPSMKRRKKN